MSTNEARNFEKEVQDRVEDSSRFQEGMGVVERLQQKVDCLTKMVAHLLQVLVDKQDLTEDDLNDF